MWEGIVAEGSAFQLAVLAALGLWCWTVYHFRPQVWACLKSTATLKALDSGTGAGNKQPYGSFVGVALASGALTVGLAAAKIMGAGSWTMARWGMTGPFGGIMPASGAISGSWIPGSWIEFAVVSGAALAVVCIVVAQTAILKGAGSLTFSEDIVEAIVRAKKTHLAALAVVALPPVVMYTGVNPARDMILAYIIVIEVIAVAAAFTAHTLILFLKQKVSLLVWFLYLCTLEIFPVCAVFLLVSEIA